jgi:hypothetical protein
MHFFKRNWALITKSDAKHEDDSYVILTSNDSSHDDQAHIIVEMVSPIANIAHFAIEKTSLNISEISYMTY